MRRIPNVNHAAAEPLTPLNPDEPIWYYHCNLTNRRVADGSIVERCQTSQIVFEPAVDEAGRSIVIPRRVGSGVGGEVTAAMVQAVRDQIGASQ